VPGWQIEGLGDCSGGDVADSPGPRPREEFCRDPDKGGAKAAVCWDASDLKNNSRYTGIPWCTYKNVDPKQCTGGSAIGRLYRCVPAQNANASIVGFATYRVCVGNGGGCPSDAAVHLSCGASVEEWARNRCRDFSSVRISSASGGQCGFDTFQVACVAPSNQTTPSLGNP